MLRWVGAVALVLAIAPAAARADGAGAVSLAVDPCVAVDGELVTRLFQVELGSALAPRSDDPATTRVEIGCAGELVELRVHDAVTGKSLTRRIAAGPATGRERLMALAEMELLVASWVELEATPAAVRRSADSTAGSAARDSARAMVRRRLPVMAASRWTTTATMVATSSWSGLSHWGGGARLVRDHVDGYGWGVDIAATTARAELSLGNVSVGAVGGAAELHLHRGRGRVRGRGGVGLRLALVSMSGDSDGRDDVLGRHLAGVVGGPLARAEIEVEVGADIVLATALEAGYHLLAMRGLVDGSPEADVDGLWLAGSIYGGWRW